MSVAVIIPFYNTQKYMQEAIHSCLIQNEVTQVILVDDGSDDDSPIIAQQFTQLDERVSLFIHPSNKGVSAARNTGMSKVNTPFFTFLDADDYFLPDRFINVLEYFEKHQNADGVYETVISHYTIPTGRNYYAQETGINEKLEPKVLFENLVLGKNHLSIIGFTFRSKSIIGLYSFDEDLNVGEDTDFIWHLAHEKSFYGIHQKSRIRRRVHGLNAEFDQTRSTRGKYLFYKKWKYKMDGYTMTSEMKQKIISSYVYFKSKIYSAKGLERRAFQWFYQSSEFLKRPSLWPSLFQNR